MQIGYQIGYQATKSSRINPVLQGIFYELAKAKQKHSWDDLDLFQRTSIMICEAGEALQVANKIHFEGKSNIDDLKSELIQTAAMCVRILEDLV